ncbi:MAG: class I SAM-dependent methyltransferase [Parachlamydiales bacterium]|nr:class I SAM-dependent methyltransferase [Parachlamydiales bacterium]
MQKDIDQKNKEFWNELCGSTLAKSLGIVDHSLKSIEKFDDAYLSFYPYLMKRVLIDRLKGKKVLEVGLGFGTLGLKIALCGANYLGLDIAEKPVAMMNHRLGLYKLPGKAIQGSILDCPLENESIDAVVSIGCFHHTGNVARAVQETYRILRPGGEAFIMVYNKFSYRQWARWPKKTFKALFEGNQSIGKDQRAAYDSDSKGEAAPETQFLSIGELKHIFFNFSFSKFTKENCDVIWPLHKLMTRKSLLPVLGKTLGLDIYIHAQK